MNLSLNRNIGGLLCQMKILLIVSNVNRLSSLVVGREELLEISDSWRLLVSTQIVLAFFHYNTVEAGGGCSAMDNISQPHPYHEVSPYVQVLANEHEQEFRVPLLGLAPKTWEVHS